MAISSMVSLVLTKINPRLICSIHRNMNAGIESLICVRATKNNFLTDIKDERPKPRYMLHVGKLIRNRITFDFDL